MKPLVFPVLGLMVWLAACKNQQDKKAEAQEVVLDSIQTARSIIAEDSFLLAERPIQTFINNTLQHTSWHWNRFSLQEFWSEDSLGKKKKPFTPGPDFYHQYAGVLRWSPDSLYILDIGSYGSVVMQDKKGGSHVVAGDPDTEVALVYPKENKKIRLMYNGPSLQVLNALWVDSSQVALLAAMEEHPTSPADTLLWLVDVKTLFFRKYKWH